MSLDIEAIRRQIEREQKLITGLAVIDGASYLRGLFRTTKILDELERTRAAARELRKAIKTANAICNPIVSVLDEDQIKAGQRPVIAWIGPNYKQATENILEETQWLEGLK